MKPIRLSGHAQEQLFYRGSSEDEIVDAIKTSPWQQAERGRLECKKEYTYEKEWNNKLFSKKLVRPIFIEQDNEIVVITVYTYFY